MSSGCRAISRARNQALPAIDPLRFKPRTPAPNFNQSRVFVLGNPHLVGGKAAGLLNLDRYRCAGFDLPRTVAIAADFFKISPRSLKNPEQIRSLPQEKIDQLFDAIRGLKGPIAIRSSSQVEDADGSVAAGIFETEFHGGPLNTPESRRRFVEKLLKVLNSAYSEKALKYWTRQGYTSIPQIPVVIQEVAGTASADGRYFLPETSGIINTSLNTSVRVSTVLGLGVTAVGEDGLGILHRVPRGKPGEKVDPAEVPKEGALNTYEIGCIDLQTGDLVHLKGDEAERLFPEKSFFAIHRTFPGTQIKLAQTALELEKQLNAANGTDHAYDLEWASDGRKIWLVQMRPIEKRKVREKPLDIPEENIILESADVMGNGSKAVRDVIHIKTPYFEPEPGTIEALRDEYPDSLFVLETEVLHRFTSAAVTKYLMPLIDALVVIDRNSTEHKSGTGLQHFALNLAEEEKVFIYTDSDAFLKAIVKKARSATPIPPHSLFSNEEITVYGTEGPLRIAADQEAGWGMIFNALARRMSKAA